MAPDRGVEAQAAIDAALPQLRQRAADVRDRYAAEEYDCLGPYDLRDLLDAQQTGVELPKPERSVHRELDDTLIARRLYYHRLELFERVFQRTGGTCREPSSGSWGRRRRRTIRTPRSSDCRWLSTDLPRRLDPHHPLGDRVACSLGARGAVELGEDVADVHADSLFSDVQSVRDLAVSSALGEFGQYFAFARG